jgi:hypothetical protein
VLLCDVGYELNTDSATRVVGNKDENFDAAVPNVTTRSKYVREQATYVERNVAARSFNPLEYTAACEAV